ncbi:hypothetical protein ATCC90586_005316 [Pythium insidiosum]|nr:hypothetical protein ATCC90586_005316 [Pythium insidiosum]
MAPGDERAESSADAEEEEEPRTSQALATADGQEDKRELDDDDDGDDDANGDNEEVDDVGEEACCICQDEVAVVTQGFLPSCDHRFHFDCIVTWAKVTNLCPLCKQVFRAVVRRDASGHVVHTETIADAKQVFRPDPNDHSIAAQLRLVNSVRCQICGRGDDEHVLLLCEAPGCMTGSHTYCIGLRHVPDHAWYCSQHGPTAGSLASDLIERPASTVSTRRRTRRIASLMSNVLRAGGDSMSPRRGQAAPARGRGARSRTRRGGDAMEGPTGRAMRGYSLVYALQMSRELQAIQQRADAMYARGDLARSTLYSRPSDRTSVLGSRTAAVSEEQMWLDLEHSRQQQQQQSAISDRPAETTRRAPASAANPNRLASSFAAEYRDIAKRMADAASHDNYASTVSLTIPKTARLRLVSQVKAFFAKLSNRERVAALDSGCLGLLFSWLQGENGTDAEATAVTLHPQVLEGVFAVLEELPVRGYREAVDAISTRTDVSIDLRERAIHLSEKWRLVDPPPSDNPPSGHPQSRSAATASGQALLSTAATAALPTITAFTPSKRPSKEAHAQPKVKRSKPSRASSSNHDTWSHLAADYVKGKLYPLYKQSQGKMSKDQFKSIVKQVVQRFREDAQKMTSAITQSVSDPAGQRQATQLSGAAKSRLMKLLDQVYREGKASSQRPAASSAGADYSAVPASLQRRAA